MSILSKNSPRCLCKNRYRPTGPDQSGSVLIYIVVVMLIFGFLGAGMISMFTSSTMMSSGVPNYARIAEYLAEAGMRYTTSELRNNGYTKGTVSTLNSTTYTLDDAGSFTVNVFGKWFEPDGDYPYSSSGTLSLLVPQGQFPSSTVTTDDFDIPANAWVVNLEGYRDALIYGSPGDGEKFTAEIQGVTYSSIHISLTDDFQANASTIDKPADPICLAVKYTGSTQTPSQGGVLNLPRDARYFFPEKYGSFHVTDTMAEKRHYFYETMTDEGTHVELAGLSEAVRVEDLDYIILSPRNHMIAATGTSVSTVSGGENFHAANYRQNITSPQDVKPPDIDLPSDVDTDTALGGMGTVGESDTGAVDVDTGTGEITLGGGVNSAVGAVFFGGDVSLGGSSVCSGGRCKFGEGLRAFFVMDYNGTGDGFTFAVIQGSGVDIELNSLGATGAIGESLGYAGVGLSGGLKPPKMALEFDTSVNSSRNDPDLGTSHRDVLQYVFWGDGQADLDDDNIHDTGGAGQKWPPYLPASGSDEVKTKPVLNSAETSLYFSSKNGYVHELDPETGVPHTGTGFPRWLGGNTESSPALDSDGFIFIGSNLEYLNVITATGEWDWYNYVFADIRSSPVIDSSDVVYFGDNDGDFYAYNSSCATPPSPCPYKWRSTYRYPGSGNDIKCTPALSPDEATVYFVSTQANYLYAVNTADGTLKWQFNILGPSQSSPTVAPDGTIYIGGDGGSFQGVLFAVNPNGTEKWLYTFSPNDARSKPAIGPDGTVYIGNDDNHLYAITDNETEGILKWRHHTYGDVRSAPMVHDDGTIWFGSNDNRLYVVDSDGLLIDKINLDGDVASPTQGTDGTVYVGSRDEYLYAYKATCNPQNIETRVFSYDDLLAGEAIEDVGDIADSDNWLNSGTWAVRIEIERSETTNARGRYEYTLSTWIRQCQNVSCSDITTTYLADTRIDYAARDPHLVQTVELCSAEHTKFNTFLYGFTQATGGATQTVVLDSLNLGFIRPGDAVITSDPNWQ